MNTNNEALGASRSKDGSLDLEGLEERAARTRLDALEDACTGALAFIEKAQDYIDCANDLSEISKTDTECLKDFEGVLGLYKADMKYLNESFEDVMSSFNDLRASYSFCHGLLTRFKNLGSIVQHCADKANGNLILASDYLNKQMYEI